MRLDELGKTGRAWVLCDCGQLLVAVDRYVTDYPPIPRGKNPESFVEFYLDEGGDPDDLINQCPACEDDLELATVARAHNIGGPTTKPPKEAVLGYEACWVALGDRHCRKPKGHDDAHAYV